LFRGCQRGVTVRSPARHTAHRNVRTNGSGRAGRRDWPSDAPDVRLIDSLPGRRTTGERRCGGRSGQNQRWGASRTVCGTRGAGDRDRTGMASLEGWGSTIELHPRDLHFHGADDAVLRPSCLKIASAPRSSPPLVSHPAPARPAGTAGPWPVRHGRADASVPGRCQVGVTLRRRPLERRQGHGDSP
jgi:hypothetical protein